MAEVVDIPVDGESQQTSSKAGSCQAERAFSLAYLGSTALDQRATLSMLPWIVAELLRRSEKEQSERKVVLYVCPPLVRCVPAGFHSNSSIFIFEQRAAHISRFVHGSRQPASFAYLVRTQPDNPDSHTSCHVFRAPVGQPLASRLRLGSRSRGMAASMEAGEDVILYDLLVHVEWPPESELAPRGSRDLDIAHKSFAKKAASAVTAPLWFVVQYARGSSSPCCSLPPGLVQLLSRQVNWQVVLSSNGKLLAVVQDVCIEIRSARDDFSATIAKCTISRDAFPQWRRVAWSHDCTLLAIAESSGSTHVFDLTGTQLFTISQATGSSGDLALAVAGLVFLEYTASAQWSAELLVINYGGHLTSYLVSLNTTQGYQENHRFSFTSHYPHGITAAVYHHTHRLLLLGGCESGECEAGTAAASGLTAWRVLSGSPHYKEVTSVSDELSTGLHRSRLLTRLPGLPRWGRVGRDQDGIYKLSLSPDASVLAAVHFSGKLSLWEVPSLGLKQAWTQEQQPGYDEVNPQWVTFVDRKRKMKDKWWLSSLGDVSWWADGALILARCSGSLTVSSARTLRNLLGPSAEWFEPAPLVTAAHGGGFLALECEVKQVSLKRPRADEAGPTHADGGDDSNDDEEADGEASLLGRSGRVVRRGLYLLTESERFAPPRKRPRNLVKTYRLVSLRSTTPEELYQRKIDSEEYGEALLLAQTYGLDTDLVYQRQWRKSPVNIASIQDYLSKIKKRSWVLHECLERLADNVDAAKELLQYGLKGTGLEALVAIGRGDDGRFIEAGDVDIEELPYEDMSPEEELERRKEKEQQRRTELLGLVNFARLTVEQKDLCRSRLRLLTYLDRLATYEEILGGPHAAEERYNTEFFKSFRSQNLVLSARNYVRESDWQALEILFRYHSEGLRAHRLPILSNFLETTSPHEYRYLLPEAEQNDDGELVVVPLHESRHRETDWCEDPQCRSGADVSRADLGDFLYEEQPELRRFRTRDPSVTLLSQWYQQRARDIEGLSRQVDSALSLMRLGQEKLVPGLEPLLDDLMLLDTLVYEAGVDPTLTLRDLQAMDSLTRLRLLMSKSPPERYVQDALRWLVPFLQRLETVGGGPTAPLLRQYLVGLARDDLALPLQIFQHSKPQRAQRIIPDNDELMRVALECTYGCTRDNQLSLCYDILECLPQRGSGQETDVTRDLHDQVDVMEQHLSVSEILEKHGLQKPISFVRDSQGSREEAAKLLTRLTRQAGRRVPPLSEEKWRGLLEDILEMQKSVYHCLDEETCYEIFTESLLCSGRAETLQLAARMVQCSAVQPVRPLTAAGPGRLQPSQRLAYARSLELVLGAAREYFNASKSLADDSMGMARECLKLITDAPRGVQEELDLMSALELLEEFKLEMLPLEVRLCQDRLSLIKKVTEQSSWAYKYPSKMLHLATLLRVAGSDRAERSGQVLTLLAEQALLIHNYRSAARLCQQIISEAYGAGWSVCSSLAQCSGALELPERQQLLAFALAHCPADTIQPLLATSCGLHAQMLYESVDGHAEPARDNSSEQHGQPEEPGGGGLLQKTSALTAGVIASTTHGTRAALQAIAQPHRWAKSLSYLRPLQGAVENDKAPQTRSRAAPERQAWHPFYESLGTDGADYKGGELYPATEVSSEMQQAQLHLQTGMLLQTSGGGLDPFPASEVLLELATETMSSDTTLALAYLLALSDPLQADVYFERQSATALSLQLAVYYYALHIHARLQPCSGQPDPVYWADPREVVARASERLATGGSAAGRPDELAVLEGRLRLYSERLTDLTQAQTLRGLGTGVDVQRFAVDAQYKRETILGLVDTLDTATYELSVSLARRYHLPLWELYMTHLEFLFTDSGLATRQVEQRVAALGLVSELKADPAGVLEHMTKYVYPGVPGGDHVRLLCYFGLLEGCGCGGHDAHPGEPGAHLQLLKKLRSTAPGLDYKKLMDASADPLDALRPVLTSQNVITVAKLVPKLPTAGGLTQSAVFAAWLRRMFWNGNGKDGGEVDWGRRYRDCEQLLDRLSPSDLDAFLQEVTVSADAIDQLPTKARADTVQRAIAFVEKLKSRPASRKKGGGGGGSSAGDGDEVTAADADCQDGARTLEDVAARLRDVQKHLRSVEDDTIAALRHSELEHERAYARAYDLACSREELVLRLAVRVALDGRPLSCVRGVLRAALGERPNRVRDALQQAVLTVIDALKEPTEALELLGGKAPLDALEGIVSAVRSHSEDGRALVSADNLLSWLRPFCADAALPVRPRVAVLQILEQAFRLGDEEGHLLAFYRTQAVLTDAWPHRPLDMAEVRDEEGRLRLFEELLSAGATPALVPHLVLLLQAWPPVSDAVLGSRDACPWLHLAAAVLSASSSPAETTEAGATVLGIARSLRGTRHALPTPCVEQLLELLLERSLLLPALKLALDSGDARLHERAVDLIATAITEVDDSTCDPELLGLLLTRGLTVACLPTALYPHLIGHLLANWETESRDVEGVAAQLKAAGHGMEAASLAMAHRRTTPALGTFNAAAGFLKQWLQG